MDNRERARARDKKQRRRILLERQRENFVSASREKMRNASGWQGEASKVKMSGSEKKKANRNTSNKIFGEHIGHLFSIKCVTRKFYAVVVQNNGKEINKKVCCTCKVVFCC